MKMKLNLLKRIYDVSNIRSRSYQLFVFLVFLSLGYIFIYQNSLHVQFSRLAFRNQTLELNLESFRKSIGITKNIKSRSSVCPIIPPGLVGSVLINRNLLSYKEIEKMNSHLGPGGSYSPTDCKPRHHVAILIPYRDRQAHLKLFLQNIHPFLKKQQIDYRIFVIELIAELKFNRAMLFNIGYMEASKFKKYDCFIFHDVDLIPENDLNLYTCAEKPRHMSVAIDKMKYKLPYPQLFGGVSALTKDQFESVNGFSNIFFGWGGEDDDMFNRIKDKKMNIIRYSADVARYKMMSHAKDTPNPGRGKLLKNGKERFEYDGINNLRYELIKMTERKLYTWILVKFDEAVVREAIDNKMKEAKKSEKS